MSGLLARSQLVILLLTCLGFSQSTIQVSQYPQYLHTAKVLPIVKYRINVDGSDGIVWGARIVGVYTGISLASAAGQSALEVLTGIAFSELKSKAIENILSYRQDIVEKPSHMVICFPLEGVRDRPVGVNDVIMAFEYESRGSISIGVPSEIILYEDLRVGSTSPRIGQLQTFETLETEADFMTISDLGFGLLRNMWVVENNIVSTIGVVNGYVHEGGKDYLIMRSYKPLDAGIFHETNMNFASIELNAQKEKPEVGSVISCRGRPVKISGSIRQGKPFYKTAVNTYAILPESIDIISGTTIQNPRFNESLLTPKGQTDRYAVTINFPHRSTKLTTLSFIIDSSGSMRDNDPDDIRITALGQILELLQSGQSSADVLVVDFDEKTRWVNSNNWKNCDYSRLKKQIRSIDSDGGTNIGGGLNALSNILVQQHIQKQRGGVLLLSDGEGDCTDAAVQWFKTNETPVYTISLVGDANAMLLGDIARSTGGKYLKARSAGDIVSRFLDFFNAIQNGNRVIQVSRRIMQGEEYRVEYFVDGSIDNAFLTLGWDGSTVGLELIDPNGRHYSEANTLSWNTGSNYLNVSLQNPIPGRWEAILSGVEIPQAGEVFKFEVNANSGEPYLLELDTAKSSLSGGVINLDLRTPQSLNSEGRQLHALVITPALDTLNIDHTIRDQTINYLPNAGVGNYEFILSVEGENQQQQKIQRQLYESVYLGEFIPGNISTVLDLQGRRYITSDIGKIRGNRVGLKFMVYADRNSDPIATGNVIKVRDHSCTLQIEKTLSSRRVIEGDIIEIDPRYWKQD